MKAKTRTKKLLSLLLAAVMLLGMIPAASLGIFAEETDANNDGVTDTLAAKLADYDNQTSFVIYTAGDWAAVAASGKNFAGKTVELGASIDAAELPTLFANFAGEFDGNECVVSNYKAMFATVTSGEASIHDLTLTDAALTVTAAKSAILVGEVTGTALTLANVNITGTVDSATDLRNCGSVVGYTKPTTSLNVSVPGCTFDVAMTATGAGTRFYPMGLLFGQVDLTAVTEPTSFVVDGCTVFGSVSAQTDIVGGVIGMVRMPNYDECDVAVKNSTINVNLTGGAFRYTAAVGGVIGWLTNTYSAWGTTGLLAASQGTVLLENLTVTGTLTTGTQGGALGGLIAASIAGGHLENATEFNNSFDTDVTIQGCAVSMELKTGTQAARRLGQVIGLWGLQGISGGVNVHGGELTIEDCTIGGKIVGPMTAESNGDIKVTLCGAGAVLGHVGYVNTTINLSNCTVTTANEGFNAGEFGVIAGEIVTMEREEGNEKDWTRRGGFTLNVEGLDNRTDVTKLFNTNHHNVSYNGTVIEPGVFNFVAEGTLTGGFEQHTATYTVTPAEGEAYEAFTIRFIATSDMDAPANAGIKAVAKDAQGNVVAIFDTVECEAYDALIGYTPSGAPLDRYTAEEYGATKFLAIVIKDVPTDMELFFEITPHYEANGVVVSGATTVAHYNGGELLNPIQ